MGDHSELIRSERFALIDFLETLTPGEWAAPSLCGAWTVQDVAAHLACAPSMPVLEATTGFARSGFRINRFIADTALHWSRRGTTAILDQLRVNASNGAKPMGMPQVAALTDAVVHALDIRRPLHKPRPIPPEAFVPVADFNVGLRWPLSIPLGGPLGGGVRSRIAGLRLVAEDVDWSHGRGPEVRGPAEAMVLLVTGRPVGSHELTGPGAAQLLARP